MRASDKNLQQRAEASASREYRVNRSTQSIPCKCACAICGGSGDGLAQRDAPRELRGSLGSSDVCVQMRGDAPGWRRRDSTRITTRANSNVTWHSWRRSSNQYVSDNLIPDREDRNRSICLPSGFTPRTTHAHVPSKLYINHHRAKRSYTMVVHNIL